jgi:5-methyltetrahydrofolate--homocysteine methyltransferase
MFRDLFLPAIERQTQFLDHTVYHVDGVAAFAHVDALCELPRLPALQILPGAGKPSPLHYLEVLQKVQQAGKNLHITIAPEEVETALAHLAAQGLFIATAAATEEEARQLLKNAEKWSLAHPSRFAVFAA